MGYTKCSAPGCKSRPGSGLLFRKFPAEENMAQKWIRQFPPGFLVRPSTALCENHFASDQFERVRQDGRKKLKASAVPTLSEVSSDRDPSCSFFTPLQEIDSNHISEHITPHPEEDCSMGTCTSNSGSLSPIPFNDFHLEQVTSAKITPEVDLSIGVHTFNFGSRSPVRLDDSHFEQVISGDISPEVDCAVGVSAANSDNLVPPPIENVNCEETPAGMTSEYNQLLLLYDQQQEELINLKQEIEEKNGMIEELNKLFASPPFRRKYRSILKVNSRLEQRVKRSLFSPHLNENQLRAITRKSNRGQRWGPDEVKDGLILKMKCGTKAYDAFVKKYPILPAARTLQDLVKFVKFNDSGLLHDVYDILESVVPSMRPRHKDCIVVLDEVEIQSGKVYDVSLGKVVGEATLPGHVGDAKKALVVILAGVSKRWKMAVAVYFTSARAKGEDPKKNGGTGMVYKDIVFSVMEKAESIGLKPCSVVSDMGPDNLAFWKACGITGGRGEVTFQIKSPKEGYPVCIMPDPLHLFKNVKSAMEHNKIIMLPSDIVAEEQLPSAVIDYHHIDDLLELESGNELKLAFRLKPSNVHVGKHFKKMSVGTSRAVLCHRTGVGLKVAAEEKGNDNYLTTAWFVMLLNTFFEIVTCRHKGLAVSKAVPSVFCKVVELIQKVERVFCSMKIGKEGVYKPCQRGMRVLCTSLLYNVNHFLEQRDYGYLMLGRFNSDCIENLFSMIRFRQAVPHASAFLQCLKAITLAQVSETIKGCNYDHDETSSLPVEDFLDKARQRAQSRATSKFFDSLEELYANPVRKLIEADFNNLSRLERSVIYDMAGSTMAHLKKSNTTLCKECIDSAKWKGQQLHPFAWISEMKEFTYFKSESKEDELLQFYVSDQVYQAILSAEITFRMYRSQAMKFVHSNVLNYFVDNLMYVWEGSSLLNCHDLGRKILTNYLTGRLKEHGRLHREALKESNICKSTMQCMSSKSAAGKEAAAKI